MCLIKTHELPKISEEEIKVYKVLLHSANFGLFTPYMKEEVKDMKLEAKHPYTDTVSLENHLGKKLNKDTKILVSMLNK